MSWKYNPFTDELDYYEPDVGFDESGNYSPTGDWDWSGRGLRGLVPHR